MNFSEKTLCNDGEVACVGDGEGQNLLNTLSITYSTSLSDASMFLGHYLNLLMSFTYVHSTHVSFKW